MDCPNCHTYNPEGRTVCWRCDKPLPRPKPEKKPRLTSQQWLYIIVGVMVLLMLANMCGLPQLVGQPQGAPAGLAVPGALWP
jgi:uncharacterized paraquat-inducible protein A